MAQVTMVLVRGPGQPTGNLDDKMHLKVVLTSSAHLDATAWETGKDAWRSARERPGHPPREGELVKIEEGWALRSLHDEDEPLYSLSAGIVRPGELVTVSRLDGDEMLYRIVSVEPD